MMTKEAKEGRDQREQREILRRIQLDQKPLPVLRLTNVSNTQATKKITKYRTTDLEKYCFENTEAMGPGERRLFYENNRSRSYRSE